jgi:hypothetical protein
METLKATTDIIMSRVEGPAISAEVRHMISLARTASDQIGSANTAYQNVVPQGYSKPRLSFIHFTDSKPVAPPPSSGNGGFGRRREK